MTLDIDTAKKYLSDVDKKHRFLLKRGHEISNLEELYDELKNISDEEFSHHITNDKNDFANWVEDCIGDKHLSDLLREVKEKEKTIDLVKSRVFVLKLMTVLKEDFTQEGMKSEEKVEDMVEKEIEKIEKEARNEGKKEAKEELKHHLPKHDISNLKGDKKVLGDIQNYLSEMEQNEEKIVEELTNLEKENRDLQRLFTKNFLHGFLLGLASGILIMIVALKIVLMTSSI
jgi:hypothetical protein